MKDNNEIVINEQDIVNGVTEFFIKAKSQNFLVRLVVGAAAGLFTFLSFLPGRSDEFKPGEQPRRNLDPIPPYRGLGWETIPDKTTRKLN